MTISSSYQRAAQLINLRPLVLHLRVTGWVMHCRIVIMTTLYLKVLDYSTIDVLLAFSERINVYRVCHEV
jgi:hypothetical protein